MSKARRELHQILTSLFEQRALRRFILFGTHGETVEADLPHTTSSSDDFVDSAIDSLHRRGLLDSTFFARLAGQFPRREDDIRTIEGLWSEHSWRSASPEMSPGLRDFDAGAIRALVLAADPAQMDPSLLGRELREIKRMVSAVRTRQRLLIQQEWTERAVDLQHQLLAHNPSMLHFSGCGSTHRGISLKTIGGEAKIVTPSALRELIAVTPGGVKIIVLNACYTDELAADLCQVADCVVGVLGAVSDDLSIEFAGALYQGLAFGRSARSAFELGCSAINLLGGVASEIAHIRCRDGVDPSSLLLEASRVNELGGVSWSP